MESEHIITPLEHPDDRRSEYMDDQNHRRHRKSDDNPARKRRRHSREQSNEREGDSDATEDLPPRFDAQGRRLPERGEDPLADKVEDLLQSSFFQNVTDNLFGGGSSGQSGRRRQ